MGCLKEQGNILGEGSEQISNFITIGLHFQVEMFLYEDRLYVAKQLNCDYAGKW